MTAQERLPSPYGLVRSGVAPDHPDTKVSYRVQKLSTLSSMMIHELHTCLSVQGHMLTVTLLPTAHTI